MSATQILGGCYSGLSSVTSQLYFFPYTGANAVIARCRARSTYNAMNSIYGNDPSLGGGVALVSAFRGQNDANWITFFLSPILAPLTIGTFALALAIDIVAFVSKIITYPIASAVDTCCLPSF